MLDSATIEIIKATVPALKIHAEEITKQFYPLLFSTHPEVVPYFNQTNQGKGTQPKALANAVIAYGANIDELGNLSDAVSQIVQKHCSLGILPSQYDAVGSCLLQAISAVLSDAATPAIIDAWGKAYAQLAQILINAEEQLYSKNEQQDGGWRGERAFKLVKKQDESTVITSFYFQPTDGGLVPEFEAGQYITLIVLVNGQPVRRNYSLSDAPGTGCLRISVKREYQGVVSNHLHTELNISDCVNLLPPCGHFVLHKSTKPLILLTAGVGITPAISMLNSSISSSREIKFVHAALNSKVHAFREHVDQLAVRNHNLQQFYVYSQPEENCQPHATGFVTLEIMAKLLPEKSNDVEFYFLGPKPFMQAALNIATRLGVPSTQIHYEFFGPTEELEA